MALQLGALREALIEAGASPEKAGEASEEVAAYDRQLTRLTTVVRLVAAATLAILLSQAALWQQMGKIDGQLAQIGAQVSHIEQAVAH
jgi:hypothetical protein